MDKVRFLMSDTSADVTAACREALEQKGVEVTVVEKDGLQILQKMLVVRPQVVLLDAFMPGLDALAVKQKYVAAGETHTTFFVTGAFQSEEMVQELLDEGFAYYFVKPFDENVLASRVLKVAHGRPQAASNQPGGLPSQLDEKSKNLYTIEENKQRREWIDPLMLKIAFCDDETQETRRLEALLEEYAADRGQDFAHTSYQSPVELMAEVEKGTRFDIILLDVLMPGENGMAAAREIREYDSNVKIIFLTSSTEFAVESYAVDAWYYQLKPIRREDFFRLMDSACAACTREQKHSLILRSKSGIVRLELEELVYCEVMGRTLTFHLNNGVVLESMGRLDDLCDQLVEYPNFLRPHRSFLINMEYIANIAARSITMQDGAVVPLPHGKYSETKDRYLSYIFDRKQVVM